MRCAREAKRRKSSSSSSSSRSAPATWVCEAPHRTACDRRPPLLREMERNGWQFPCFSRCASASASHHCSSLLQSRMRSRIRGDNSRSSRLQHRPRQAELMARTHRDGNPPLHAANGGGTGGHTQATPSTPSPAARPYFSFACVGWIWRRTISLDGSLRRAGGRSAADVGQ